MHMATFKQVIGVLRPVIVPVYSALQSGLDEATTLHAQRQHRRSDDPHYFVHTVRRVAAEQLRAEGFLAESEDADRPALSLSGLLVHHGGVALRILRPELDRRGKILVPVPGRSQPRQAFWRQEPQLPGMETDNILLLWSDEDGAVVDPMVLVRPLAGDHRRDSLQLEWRGRLSRSMASLRAADLDELVPDIEYQRIG
jgi:hypothetical protein